MVNQLKIIFIIIFIGCSSNNVSIKDGILIQYNKGIESYNNKKYSKAKDSFEYVILHSAGSRLALESEFYLAESLYNLKEYEQALISYDNYARSSQDLKLIEQSRFRLCQCAYELTNDYKKDQSNTVDAIEKIEFFLEDYLDSQYYEKAIILKSELKYKLAKKEYESAMLYMKLEEYKSALVYLLDILNNYNEASFYAEVEKNLIDDVRITVIYAYILDENYDIAQEFYNLHKDNFTNLKLKDKAYLLINEPYNTFNAWKDIYFGISK